MIYYYCTDHDSPSWGMAMLYYHVYFLNKNNINACILHDKPGFKLSWLNLNIPIKYIKHKVVPQASDIMVVPEGNVQDKILQSFKCRKYFFLQNSFILFERVAPSALNKLAFAGALYYLPHLRKILSTYFEGPLYETSIFVADYFYKEPAKLHDRKRQIIIYPKSFSRDYNVVERILPEYYKPQGFFSKLLLKHSKENNWEIVVLKDYTHETVASLMKEAAFFINLNTYEAFNSSVPEAMAAGCINFSFDAFGPSDFLEDGVNAFVFNNNHVFPLLEKLKHYTDNYEDVQVQEQLKNMRLAAFATAQKYTSAKAEKEIVDLMNNLNQN